MESVTLLDRARQAGLVVLRDGDRLTVRGPKRLADLAVHLLDHKVEVMAALDAEADPGVAMALDVFRGATVVAAGQPAGWPPAGSWLQTPSRTLDPYGTATPTTSCPCCGATAWYRAGTGFTCAVCHPPVIAATAARQLRRTDRTGFSLPSRTAEENRDRGAGS